jgi:hypothetical protein
MGGDAITNTYHLLRPVLLAAAHRRPHGLHVAIEVALAGVAEVAHGTNDGGAVLLSRKHLQDLNSVLLGGVDQVVARLGEVEEPLMAIDRALKRQAIERGLALAALGRRRASRHGFGRDTIRYSSLARTSSPNMACR